MNVVTNQVVTPVVTGGNVTDFPLIVTTVTTKEEEFNKERKQVETRIPDDVTEMRLRWLRGNTEIVLRRVNGTQISHRAEPQKRGRTTTRAVLP